MKKNKIIILTGVILILMITVGVFSIRNGKKEYIEKVLSTKAYSYLSPAAKEYVKETYERTGEIILTEKNKRIDEPYLNPAYIKYLESDTDSGAIPPSTIFDYNYTAENDSELPSAFDLSNVNGKNFVTPYKNQGSEGLCWDFATNAQIESLLLVKQDTSYDENATILSEKQIDYATATNSMEVDNKLYNNYRTLTSGGFFDTAMDVMVDGLGIVPSSWDEEHKTIIENNNYLDGSAIYDFNNSLYEVNNTIDFPRLNLINANSSKRENYLKDIKKNIINYGGAYVSVDICYDTLNNYNGNWISVVDVMEGGSCNTNMYHALQIVGWDDNFEYTVCKRNHGSVKPDKCGEGGSVTGKGVWILKNSWGDQKSTILLAYDSLDTVINLVTDIGKRKWDNFYKLERKKIDTNTNNYEFKTDSYIENEKLQKIKVKLGQNTNYKFYIDINGDNDYEYLDEITSNYSGYYTLDINKVYNINNNTNFKVVSGVNGIQDFRLYTMNNNSDKKIKTEDVIYDVNIDELSPKDALLNVYSKTKNIDSKEELKIRIKDSSGNYMSEDSYEYKYNKVYANINNAQLILDPNVFKKGIYELEIYNNNILYSTATLTLNNDLIVFKGNGTEDNPWQINDIIQFNSIRNNPNDNYILMNDIDFEYDTTNENGLLYNEGNGWRAIEQFGGYLDGNGHKLINIYSKAKFDEQTSNEIFPGGLFDTIVISDNCNFDKCGIENLTIENPNIIGGYHTGGVVNDLYIYYNYNTAFNNISVIGGKITNVKFPSHSIGGVIGNVYLNDPYEFSLLSFNNIYNSSNIVGANKDSRIDETLGGIFGDISGETNNADIHINNVMNVGKITPAQKTYAKSSIFNTSVKNTNFILKNIIAINNKQAFVVDSSTDNLSGTSATINNVYTDSEAIAKDSLLNINFTTRNTLTNLSPVEIANANYKNWTDFNKNWYQYNLDGIKRIPMLKSMVNYFDFTEEIADFDIGLNSTKNIYDLIRPNIEQAKNIEYSYDDEYLTISDKGVISPKKLGTTTIHIDSLYDGYARDVQVTIKESAPVVYNSNDGTGTTKTDNVIKNETFKLTKNSFDYKGHTFKNWNTKADGSGTTYTDEQLIESGISEELKLYAQWDKTNYTITLNGNGGLYNNEEVYNWQGVYSNEGINLANIGFTKENYFIDSWNTKANGTGTKVLNSSVDFENIPFDEENKVTLYAQWESIVTSIKLDKLSMNLEEGESKKLNVIYNPSTASNVHVNWSSSNEAVAVVNNGVVTAISEGTAVITVTADNGLTASANITVYYNNSFKDVNKSDWYYETVKFASENKIILGYNSTTFAPNDNITRGQLVTILWRLEGEPNASSLPNNFSDVDENYYTSAVKWASSNKIVNGYGGTTKFGPNDLIIRQDLAVILNNYAKYKELDLGTEADLSVFGDYNLVKGNYSEPALKWAVGNGVMNGKNVGKTKKEIQGGAHATRAEAAAMVMNFIKAYNLL